MVGGPREAQVPNIISMLAAHSQCLPLRKLFLLNIIYCLRSTSLVELSLSEFKSVNLSYITQG